MVVIRRTWWALFGATFGSDETATSRVLYCPCLIGAFRAISIQRRRRIACMRAVRSIARTVNNYPY